MKLKTVEIDGRAYAEVVDGKPVFVADDGNETPVDAAGALAAISRLNAEAKGHREGKEAAEKALKAFEGIEAEAARRALEMVAGLDGRRLADVEDVRRGFQAELSEKDGRIAALEARLTREAVSGAFARSRLIAERLAIPSDLAEARFGGQFQVQDGVVVGVGADGARLYSRTRPGEIAGFDEALEMIIEVYPERTRILKGTVAAGGGASSGGAGATRAMTLAAFNALDARTRAARMAEPGFRLVE